MHLVTNTAKKAIHIH